MQKLMLVLGHPINLEMATHSSVVAWRIPGTEEPGGLLSLGLHRVGHDWSDLAAAAADFREKSCIEGAAKNFVLKNFSD